jgi:hypothetical protein
MGSSARASLAVSDLKSKIQDWRDELNNNFAEELSAGSEELDAAAPKRKAECNLELELLSHLIK